MSDSLMRIEPRSRRTAAPRAGLRWMSAGEWPARSAVPDGRGRLAPRRAVGRRSGVAAGRALIVVPAGGAARRVACPAVGASSRLPRGVMCNRPRAAYEAEEQYDRKFLRLGRYRLAERAVHDKPRQGSKTGMKPGGTMFTVIPDGASSRAQLRARPICALSAAALGRPAGGRSVGDLGINVHDAAVPPSPHPGLVALTSAGGESRNAFWATDRAYTVSVLKIMQYNAGSGRPPAGAGRRTGPAA